MDLTFQPGTGGGGGSGTVTSVALSMPSIFSVAGSPIVAAGTFTVTLANETANTVFAGPTSGGAAAPTFRALVAADYPTMGGDAGAGGTKGAVPAPAAGDAAKVLSGAGTWVAQTAAAPVSSVFGRTGAVVAVAGDYGPTLGGTGQTTYATGDMLYASGANTLAKLAAGTNGYVLTMAGGVPTWAAAGGGGANTALSNLAAVAINATLVSDTDNTDDLGTSSVRWKDSHLRGKSYFYVANAGVNPTYIEGVDDGATSVGGVNIRSAFSGNPRYLFYSTIYSGRIGALSDVTFTTGSLVALDGDANAASLTAGDSGFTKSAVTGGNMSSKYDGTEITRDDGTNCRVLASRGWGLYTAIGDTNASVNLIGSGVTMGAGGATAVDVRVRRSAVNVFTLDNAGGGGATQEFIEMTAPSAPAANTVRIYAEDNGAGKTRLMALFNTGAAQQIAIEP